MGAIGLLNGEAWVASGATVLTLLRFAFKEAPTDAAKAEIDKAVTMNGLGLSLDRIRDLGVRDEVRQALVDGARAMQVDLQSRAELARSLEEMLLGEQ
ncbi:MAG: hypothetical protein GY708_09000 [Actinomycetia bacterium]|nr:hypothetical protein [Actinomycetes bacterium]